MQTVAKVSTDGHAYRYERKFVSRGPRAGVESIVRLHPRLFRPLFHRRWVNNIYLDTWTLASYEENIAGSSVNRVKVRVRWYGDFAGLVERPNLELKIKHNVVNRKETFSLGPLRVDEGLSNREVQRVFQHADLPAGLRSDLLKLRPTLVNRYSRSYFRSADEAFRITIDSNLSFDAFKSYDPERRRWCDAAGIILELKYGTGVAERAGTITQHLPFRLARSSKYVSGIQRIRQRFGVGDGTVGSVVE